MEVRTIKPRECVERVRETIPHVNAVDGLRACRLLARLLNTPMDDHGSVITEVLANTPHRDAGVTAARAAHLAIPSDGTMEPHQSAPEPYTASKHTVRRGRNKKGATAKVIARGAATVQGASSYIGPRPFLAESLMTFDEREALALALVNVRRIQCGAVALDVLRATDATFAPFDVPALLGTDVMGFEQLVPGDRTSRCAVAVSAAGVTGLAISTAADVLAAHGAVYTAHTGRADDLADGTGDSYRPGATGKVADMQSRRRIAFRRRVSERPVITVAWVAGERLPKHDATFVRLCGGWDFNGHIRRTVRLVTGHDRTVTRVGSHWSFGPTDRVFIGHECRERTAVVRRSHARRARTVVATVRRQQRTIGTMPAPATVAGWRELLANLNRDERVLITVADGGTQTVTRGKRGKYATRGPLGQWSGIRTPDALALRLAA